jgi:hypothetical protein
MENEVEIKFKRYKRVVVESLPLNDAADAVISGRGASFVTSTALTELALSEARARRASRLDEESTKPGPAPVFARAHYSRDSPWR